MNGSRQKKGKSERAKLTAFISILHSCISVPLTQTQTLTDLYRQRAWRIRLIILQSSCRCIIRIAAQEVPRLRAQAARPVDIDSKIPTTCLGRVARASHVATRGCASSAVFDLVTAD